MPSQYWENHHDEIERIAAHYMSKQEIHLIYRGKRLLAFLEREKAKKE
jgi:hypothetical protein